jgi:hypothetical protein
VKSADKCLNTKKTIVQLTTRDQELSYEAMAVASTVMADERRLLEATKQEGVKHDR